MFILVRMEQSPVIGRSTFLGGKWLHTIARAFPSLWPRGRAWKEEEEGGGVFLVTFSLFILKELRHGDFADFWFKLF